jgi:hypothetical protein
MGGIWLVRSQAESFWHPDEKGDRVPPLHRYNSGLGEVGSSEAFCTSKKSLAKVFLDENTESSAPTNMGTNPHGFLRCGPLSFRRAKEINARFRPFPCLYRGNVLTLVFESPD